MSSTPITSHSQSPTSKSSLQPEYTSGRCVWGGVVCGLGIVFAGVWGVGGWVRSRLAHALLLTRLSPTSEHPAALRIHPAIPSRAMAASLRRDTDRTVVYVARSQACNRAL